MQVADFLPPDGGLDVYEAAVAWFQRKLELTEEAMATIVAGAKSQAKIAARWAQLQMTADIIEAGREGIKSGASVFETKEKIKASLHKKWSVDVKDNQLETTIRTNQQRSYSAGRWEQIQETKGTHSYLKFSAIMDSLTTPQCVACNGIILPVSDPFWETHRPPLHFNCRSNLVPIRETVAKRLGITETKPVVEVPYGFGDPTEEWKPDHRSLPRRLVKNRKTDKV